MKGPSRGTSGGKAGSSKPPIASPPGSATLSTATITVDQLSTPDSEVVGTLERDMGGFGQEMWRGTPRSLIDNLLPQLPIAIRSPTMRDLARRLLLSTSIVAVCPPRLFPASNKVISCSPARWWAATIPEIPLPMIAIFIFQLPRNDANFLRLLNTRAGGVTT